MSGGHGHSGPSMRSLYLIFLSTFLFGFVLGLILYLVNHIGAERIDWGSDQEEFAIIAYMYGGCARGGNCTSYRIAEDGTYTYLVRNQNDGQRRIDDELSRAQLTTLRSQLGSTPFEALSDTEFTGTCPVEFDGIAYRYDIEYQGKSYTFDSCVEDIDDDQFFTTLEEYFEVFALMHTE